MGRRSRLANSCNCYILLLLKHVEYFEVALFLSVWIVSELTDRLVGLLLLNFLRGRRVRLILAGFAIEATHGCCRHLCKGKALHQCLVLALSQISALLITHSLQVCGFGSVLCTLLVFSLFLSKNFNVLH